jgi:hypothetical protein
VIRPSWAKALLPHRPTGDLARLAADYFQAALALDRHVDAMRRAIRSARRFDARSILWAWADARCEALAAGCRRLEAARDRRRDGLLGAWPRDLPGLEIDGAEIWRYPHPRKLGLWNMAVISLRKDAPRA